MEKERNKQALTALQKAFGAVAATNVVAFLTGLIAKAVLESQKLTDQIEAAIDKRFSALPAPTAPADMTEEEEQEARQEIAKIAQTTLDESRQEIIDEATAKATEGASSGTTAAIGQQLTVALADLATIRSLANAIASDTESLDVLLSAILVDPVKVVKLANALANNEEACSTLQKAIYFASLTAKDEAKNRRMNYIAEAIFAIYNERSGGTSELTDDDIEPLVNRVEDEGVVRGKRSNFFVDTIGAWLTEQESKMAEVITQMAYANTAPADIETYAKLLILAGVTIDNTDGIRERLGDKDIKLKK